MPAPLDRLRRPSSCGDPGIRVLAPVAASDLSDAAHRAVNANSIFIAREYTVKYQPGNCCQLGHLMEIVA